MGLVGCATYSHKEYGPDGNLLIETYGRTLGTNTIEAVNDRQHEAVNVTGQGISDNATELVGELAEGAARGALPIP